MLQRVGNHVLQVCTRPPEPQYVLWADASSPYTLCSRLWSLPSQFLTGPKILRQHNGTRGQAALSYFSVLLQLEHHQTRSTPPRRRKAILGLDFFLFFVTATFFLPYLEAFFPRLRLYITGSMHRIPPHENGLCHLIRVTQDGE